MSEPGKENMTAQIAAGKAMTTGRVLLSVRDLYMSFDGYKVLDGIDLDLHESQVVLLRGSNGSGKTTLVNILTGYLSPDKGTIRVQANGFEEEFVFPRRWWQDLNPWDHFLPERVARKGICRSWQDTRLFSSIRLVDNVAVADSNNPSENPVNILLRPGYSRIAETQVENRSKTILSELGLNGRGDSSADKVSLGQAKRVAIARASGTGARILFLDEPLAGLDGPGIESVVDLLRHLVAEHRMALVLVEHVSNVAHILPLVDTIWDLADGILTESQTDDSKQSDTDFSESAIGLQRLTAGLDLHARYNLPGGARLDIFSDGNEKNTKPVLEVKDLVVHRGRRLVIGTVGKNSSKIRGISITLNSGDLAILQAPNGWGKTTFLDSLAGLLPVGNGTIRLMNHDVTTYPPWERAIRGLHYLRSDCSGFNSLNVEEVQQIANNNDAYLSSINPDLQYAQLSGGEKKRVQFQTIQSKNSFIFALDEPFSALDQYYICEISDAIRTLVEKKKAVIIAVPSQIKFEEDSR